MSDRFEIRGDELDLYAGFHFELVGKVQRRVNTSRENVEDACAFAWLQFFKHQPDRDGAWKGWLYRVAQREAYTLEARDRRTVDLADDNGREIELPDPGDRQADRDEFIAAVQELRRLPPRLQQLVLLRSQVDTQHDLAKVVGLSPSRVSVLLRKAAHLVEASGQELHTREPAVSSRAGRLRGLEDAPPAWLVNAIGPRPGGDQSTSARVVAWRRTALLIDDYRERVGHSSATDPLGATPMDRDSRRAYRRVEHAVQEFLAARSQGTDRSL